MSELRQVLSGVLQKLARCGTRVSFADTAAVEPVSRTFGLERGMPIDRFYIERFLAQHAPLIRGEVLEIGASEYTRRFGGSAVTQTHALNVRENGAAGVIVGDLTDPDTLPAAAMDCFICTQTLNFIYDVRKAVAGAHHLLKPGGAFLATVAGISQISRYDMERWGDYWRFTTASLAKVVGDVFGPSVTVASHGNLAAAIAFLQGLAVEDLPDRTVLETADPDYQMLLTVVARKGEP